MAVLRAVIIHVSLCLRKSVTCDNTGVNVWHGVNLKQGISGNEHMGSGGAAQTARGRGTALSYKEELKFCP